jgi:hypothetical protein
MKQIEINLNYLTKIHTMDSQKVPGNALQKKNER